MMFFVYTMKLCDELLGTSIPIYEIMIEFYERLASWDLGKNSGRIIHSLCKFQQVKRLKLLLLLPAIILGVIKSVYTVVSKTKTLRRRRRTRV